MKFRSFMESDPFDLFPNKASLMDKPPKLARPKKARRVNPEISKTLGDDSQIPPEAWSSDDPTIGAWGAKVPEPEATVNTRSEPPNTNDQVQQFKSLARAHQRAFEIGKAIHENPDVRAKVRTNILKGMSGRDALDDLLVHMDHQPLRRAKLAKPMRPTRLAQPRDFLPQQDPEQQNPYIAKQMSEPVPQTRNVNTALPSPTFGRNTGGGRRVVRSSRNA